MPRKKENKCPVCGSTDIEIIKTWQLVSPFPDRRGRITITVMGVMKCRNCGHQWRGVVSKLKVGGSSVAIGDKELKEEKEERRVKEIVLDLDEIDEEDEDLEI